MFGRPCPECGYSSHDENGTSYHNNCLQSVSHRRAVMAFVAGFVVAFMVFCLVF